MSRIACAATGSVILIDSVFEIGNITEYRNDVHCGRNIEAKIYLDSVKMVAPASVKTGFGTTQMSFCGGTNVDLLIASPHKLSLDTSCLSGKNACIMQGSIKDLPR